MDSKQNKEPETKQVPKDDSGKQVSKDDPEKQDPMWKNLMNEEICTRADLERVNKESYAYWKKWIEKHMPGYCVEDFDLYHHNCDLDEEELANLS